MFLARNVTEQGKGWQETFSRSGDCNKLLCCYINGFWYKIRTLYPDTSIFNRDIWSRSYWMADPKLLSWLKDDVKFLELNILKRSHKQSLGAFISPFRRKEWFGFFHHLFIQGWVVALVPRLVVSIIKVRGEIGV